MARIGHVRRVWVCDPLCSVGGVTCVTCTPLLRGHPNTPRRGPYISIYARLTGTCSLNLLYNKKI